jgi:riboflavin synthase
MFTGIVQEVGRVVRFEEVNGKRRLTIAAKHATREVKVGDSVAVSGVCLTAVDMKGDQLGFDLAAETVARTSLARLQPGSLVNLELPLRPSDRLGGHFMQGHVDGTGRVLDLEKIVDAEDYWLHVEVPASLERYVVQKGSIAVEGISLTVARIEATEVTIAIIPHTWEATNLKSLRTGDAVNIEVDIIAKYAEKLLQGEREESVSVEELMRQGF